MTTTEMNGPATRGDPTTGLDVIEQNNSGSNKPRFSRKQASLPDEKRRSVEEIINSKFTRVAVPKDEQLERAKEVWLSLSREKTLVSLPKVPDSFAAEIFDASDGILQQAYSEAYHATLKHTRRPSGS